MTFISRGADRDGAASEWVHEEWFSEDDVGCTLKWDAGAHTWIPWTSVLRVDIYPCNCFECMPGKKKLA